MADFLGLSGVIDKFVSMSIDVIAENVKAVAEVREELEHMKDKMKTISAVIEDAEDKAYSDMLIKIWVRDLKSVYYDIDDLMDKIAYDNNKLELPEEKRAKKAMKTIRSESVSSSSQPINIKSRIDYSGEIRTLRQKLDLLVERKNNFNLNERRADHSSRSRDQVGGFFNNYSFVRQTEVLGRDDEKENILNQISAAVDTKELSILPIVGIGGVGKTAFAKLVGAQVHDYGFERKFWVCVSDPFEPRRIIEDILNHAGVKVNPNQLLNALVRKLRDLLCQAKYFLVLDDVWLEDSVKWNEFKNILVTDTPGSVVLITTRDKNVASICKTTNMEPYYLERLSDDVCWGIFKKLALPEDNSEMIKNYPELAKIGQAIVRKCCGIPLVVSTLAGLLRYDRYTTEWQRIRDIDFCEIDEYKENVIEVLKLSYDKLPYHVKPCFALISIFKKDGTLPHTLLTYYWSALGFLKVAALNRNIENAGRFYFVELASRSLLNNYESYPLTHQYGATIHDFLHDLAKNILGEEHIEITSGKMINVSKFTRHVTWGYEVSRSLEDKQFPTLENPKSSVRTFKFNYDVHHISRSIVEGIIFHFPCLRILDFGGNCFDELPESVGDLIHLRYLDLSFNTIITNLPETISKLLNLEVLNIRDCKNLTEIPKGVFELQSLRLFEVTTCQKSLVYKKPNNLSSLNFLVVDGCLNLEYLWDSENVGGLTTLQSIYIRDCPKLKNLPTSMSSLDKLENLTIWNCEDLDLEEGQWCQNLQSLKKLYLKELPKLKSIPTGIQSAANSLEEFFLGECTNLENLPDLSQFTSLRKYIVL